MGENGAGKSTLMKILSGAYQADPGGEIRINGQHVTIDGPLTARHHGISIIYQELSLAPNLSVAENMLLGREHKSGPMVDRRSMEKACQAVLERLGVHFKATTKVSELSMAERQLVEIARALIADSRILVMDEPTTSLSSRETEALFALIRQLRAEGLAIIYISHRMAEIYELAERVSVLRDGSYVGTLVGDEISAERLVQMMVGRDLSSFYKKEHDAHQSRGHGHVRGPQHGRRRAGARLLVRAARGRGSRHRRPRGRRAHGAGPPHLRRRSADERRGLPPGQAPVDPSAGGCDQFRRRLSDGGPQASRPLPRSHRPRERERQRALAGCAHGRRPQPEAAQAAEPRQRSGRSASASRRDVVPVGSLSGGNQQKVLLSRLLETKPKVLILDEPTRGVDIGAKSEIYRLIDSLARNGVGVIVISSELPEVVGICDRVLVMREGRLAGEVGGAGHPPVTQENIITIATGVREAAE